MSSRQIGVATDRAKVLATRIGFSPAEAEEVALVTSELASNLVRHAGGGLIILKPLLTGHPGIQIESFDSGPGIADVELALTDGFSTQGGLGNGLGTVNRLMDKLEFHHRLGLGLRIVCQRWIRPSRRQVSGQRLECGAATRPSQLAQENGDALIIQQWADQALLGVIDGLGHGRFACQAAQAARRYVEHHFDQPLAELFRGVGRACQATRGVVMALARVDLTQSTVAIAGLGNIEVRLLSGSKPHHVVVRRGILGAHAPSPSLTQQVWSPNAILVLHSDGVHSRWPWDDYLNLFQQDSGRIAQQLLLSLGKPEDDATVVVAKNALL